AFLDQRCRCLRRPPSGGATAPCRDFAHVPPSQGFVGESLRRATASGQSISGIEPCTRPWRTGGGYHKDNFDMRVVLAVFLMLSLIGAARAETNAAPAPEAAYVRVIQDELAKLGYYKGTIDGKAGPETEQAIRAWQHASGRKEDGIPTA